MNNFSAAITPSDMPIRFETDFPEAAATLAWLYEQPKAMIRRLLYAPEVATPKPDRNAPCPCGKKGIDGVTPLKYKKCCGRQPNSNG